MRNLCLYLAVFIAASPLAHEIGAQIKTTNANQTASANSKRLFKYVGKYPSQLFRSEPQLKIRLRKILGKKYGTFMANLGTEMQIGYDDGNLIISGCASGFCGTYEAIMVVDVGGKSINCAILDGGRKFQTYSDGKALVPTTFTDQILLRETEIR